MTGLPIYFEQRLVGRIVPTAAGAQFAYTDEWLGLRAAFPISLSMPLAQQSYGPEIILPWAANLLPESNHLRAVGQYLGVAPEDVLGLLTEIGRDTAGALSVGQPGTPDPTDWRRIESEAALERIIEELPNKPFLVGEDGISMSLAGAQTKLPVAVDAAGHLYVPANGSPSTHILKPNIPRLWGSVQNEAFCLTLAQLCGLPVPFVTTGRAGGRSYFLIARYDRRQADGLWRRLHQEDFCQALRVPPSAKYERNSTGVRGPTFADMFGVVRAHMTAPDTLRLLDAAIFNVLVCNTDAHAKNYSVLLSPGAPRLAPLYDVMCAEPFENVTRNLAQTIAGKNRGEHLKRRHWVRFAEACGLRPQAAVGRVAELARLATANTREAADRVAAMPAGDHGVLPLCVDAVLTRARALVHGLEEGAGETVA